MGLMRLLFLLVMLFFTWSSTSNVTRPKGKKEKKATDDKPVHRGHRGVVLMKPSTTQVVVLNNNFNVSGVNGDGELSMDNATAIKGKHPRGLTHFIENPQDPVLVRVDEATADTLKSHLTTIFLPILYIIVFVVGLPANTMALWVFLFRTKKKHPSAIYMANLALSDVLFVIWIPLKIAYHFNGNDWIYGEGLCKVLVGFFYGNMYCSILFIACLSVQRCSQALCEQKGNNKVAIGVCVSIWVFIWTTTIPLYQYDHTVRVINLNITTCHDVSAIWDTNNPFASVKYPYYYFMLMATVVFLIPCIVIVVAYALLFWYLKKKMVHNVDRTAEKNRHKTLMLMVTVLVTFLVCFIPSNIMLVIHYSLLSIDKINNGYGFYITTLCLASLNSCLDPFIYYFVSDDFRKDVKNTLLCRSRRAVESIESVEKYRKNKSYVPGNTESSSLSNRGE